jgi:hypothetical protein
MKFVWVNQRAGFGWGGREKEGVSCKGESTDNDWNGHCIGARTALFFPFLPNSYAMFDTRVACVSSVRKARKYLGIIEFEPKQKSVIHLNLKSHRVLALPITIAFFKKIIYCNHEIRKNHSP